MIVSRGQLIEIGGSFRLPEVMAQSQARLVEVGATNRTHLKDYRQAITPETAALMRVHPEQLPRRRLHQRSRRLGDLAELAHQPGLDPDRRPGRGGAAWTWSSSACRMSRPCANPSQTGADVVLFSGDKLIGASQAGSSSDARS